MGKRLIALIVALTMLGSFANVAADSLIKDISKSSSYAAESILRLEEQGIVKGDEKGNFNPKSPITRGEMVVMLVRVLGIDISDAPGKPTFKDVPANHWAYKYIEAAYHAGIVNGVSKTEFGINQTTTREQIAAMFVRAFKLQKTAGTIENTNVNRLSDKASISSWAIEAVETAMQNGVMNGTTPTTFGPKLNALREQAAVMLDRMLKKETIVYSARSEYAYGNYQENGNISSRGIIDQYAGWIYFTGDLDADSEDPAIIEANKLYKSRVDGTGLTKISDVHAGSIKVEGDWIFYRELFSGNIYKIKKDGTSNTKVIGDRLNYYKVMDGWIYYSNSNDQGKLYKITVNGTDKMKLSDDVATYIVGDGDWVYYTNHTDNWRLYKIKTDGTERTALTEGYARDINLEGEWLYYTTVTEDNNSPIYKIKIDGTENTKLNNFRTASINVSNGWIYYVLKDGRDRLRDNWRYGIYKMKVDGTEVTKLSNEAPDFINVTNDELYFHMGFSKSLWKMQKDGSNVQWTGLGTQVAAPATVIPDAPYVEVNITLGTTQAYVDRMFGYDSKEMSEDLRYNLVYNYFGGSQILFKYKDGEFVVNGWDNQGNLKVSLQPADPAAAPITLGSTIEDVAKAMGTPKILNPYYWDYENKGRIYFDMTGKVEAWKSINNGLKVWLGDKKEDAAPFTIGSDQAAVLDAMGTPEEILLYRGYTEYMEWKYGQSVITFTQENTVEAVNNIDNNLNFLQ